MHLVNENVVSSSVCVSLVCQFGGIVFDLSQDAWDERKNHKVIWIKIHYILMSCINLAITVEIHKIRNINANENNREIAIAIINGRRRRKKMWVYSSLIVDKIIYRYDIIVYVWQKKCFSLSLFLDRSEDKLVNSSRFEIKFIDLVCLHLTFIVVCQTHTNSIGFTNLAERTETAFDTLTFTPIMVTILSAHIDSIEFKTKCVPNFTDYTIPNLIQGTSTPNCPFRLSFA